MNRSEALLYLESLEPAHIELGLERIERVLERLQRPQDAYASIHVAGTNGKGSTCAMAAAALRKAGLRTGFYSSPHLRRFEERIAVDGEPISGEALGRGVDLVRAAAEGIPLTYFEFGTALAFCHFRESGVQVAVLETGLGGRLDATNVVRPVATAITALGLDHTALLGSTLAAIAGEKAGILKPGVPCAVAAPPEEAAAVIFARAASLGCELWVEGRDFSLSAGRYQGRHWEVEHVEPGLRGPHQRQNAAVAMALLELASRRLSVGPEAARLGVREARWPGRLETFERGDKTVVLDGAHNPDGARALARALKDLWPGRAVHLVFGVLSDKDARPMVEALFPLATQIWLAAPSTARARQPRELLELAPGRDVRMTDTVRGALEAALASAARGDLIVVCGSLYVVAEARAALLA